jgi:hypothetical protein
VVVIVATAWAAPEAAFAAVSSGPHVVPQLGSVMDFHLAYRVEAGAGSARLQGYGMGLFTAWNAVDWEYAANPGAPLTPGDGELAEIGGGARYVVLPRPVSLTARVEAGASAFACPIPADLYEQATSGVPIRTGRASIGGWLGVGGDVGVALGDDVGVQASVDAAYLTNPGFGLTLGARLGLVARL